ncbi:Uncharacterised protein [Mycobacterium tuberculosis]|nr:Uncharacterised protein [Mycobacterium tuberculosis]
MSTPQTRKPRKASKPVNPRLRRMRNLQAFWQARYEAVADDHGELARVTFDRARAAARRVERSGLRPLAMHELAQLLNEWAERLEAAETKHDAGNAP